MTLALLWQEYLSGQASERLQLHAVLRGLRRLAQAGVADDATNALAGEKLSTGRGDSIAVADPATGKEGRAHVFVAALGAPGGRFAEPGDVEAAGSSRVEPLRPVIHTNRVDAFVSARDLIALCIPA